MHRVGPNSAVPEPGNVLRQGSAIDGCFLFEATYPGLTAKTLARLRITLGSHSVGTHSRMEVVHEQDEVDRRGSRRHGLDGYWLQVEGRGRSLEVDHGASRGSVTRDRGRRGASFCGRGHEGAELLTADNPERSHPPAIRVPKRAGRVLRGGPRVSDRPKVGDRLPWRSSFLAASTLERQR